jgi:hypothetical protein
MKLVIVICLLAASTLAASAQQKVGGLTSYYRKDHVELEDKQGQVVLWFDSWARLHSPEYLIWQQNYNARVFEQFRGLIGIGLSAPEGIQLVPPQPPGLRGIQSSVVFAVPFHLAENGVLTRDTLSILFYTLGIEWNYLAHNLASDCETANRAASIIDCRNYKIDWRTSPNEPRTPLADDRMLFELRYTELQKGLVALRRLQTVLAGVMTLSAEGERGNMAHDRELYGKRNAECLQWSVNYCTVEDAGPVGFSFDWLTAQVDPAGLSPELLAALHQSERDAQLSITSATDEEEMSRGRLP